MGFESSRHESLEKEETRPSGFEAARERFAEKEKTILERLSNKKLRNVLLSFTSFVTLMTAAPAFGAEQKRGGAAAESGYVLVERGQLEFSTEELVLKKEIEDVLAREGVLSQERAELFSFAKEHGVPFIDLKEALGHRGKESDALMLLQAYAVAYDAVFSKAIGEKHQKHFQDFILPNLKNGAIVVEKKEQDKFIGASYDSLRDAYMNTSINVFDVEDRGITIHELTHAYQDGAKLTHKREDSELEAYTVQAEYVLRQRKLLVEDPNGAIALSPEASQPELFEKFSLPQQIVFFQMIIRNIEKGRNDLNIVEADGVKISEIENLNDAKLFCEAQLGYIVAKAKLSWSLSTSALGFGGGKIIDIGESLQKDGFKRLSP